MVDFSDVAKINQLSNELQSIASAVALFDDGGKIVNMTVAKIEQTFPPTGPGTWVMLQTQYMDYPAQMVTGIKALLMAREQALLDELAKLGVTGIDVAAMKAAATAARLAPPLPPAGITGPIGPSGAAPPPPRPPEPPRRA